MRKARGSVGVCRKSHRRSHNGSSHRGFMVTLDSIIALLLSIFFVSYTFSIVNTFPSYESISYVRLQRIGEDTLNVMEMTNAFGSQPSINSILQQTGDQNCMRLEIYNQTFSPAAKKDIFTKPGCTAKKSQDTTAEERVFRTFYSGGDFKYAVLSVWLKEN